MFNFFKKKKQKKEIEEEILEQEELASDEESDASYHLERSEAESSNLTEEVLVEREEPTTAPEKEVEPEPKTEEQRDFSTALEMTENENDDSEVTPVISTEVSDSEATPVISTEVSDSERSGEISLEQASESEEQEPDIEEEPATEQEEEPAPEKKQGGFKSLFSGLNKTRKKIGDQLDNLLNNYDEIDDDLYEEIEDILITADIGMKCTMELIDNLKEELVNRKVKDASQVKLVLRDVMAEYLKTDDEIELATKSPSVILVIGVNGAGKTTSIGKISHKLKSDGKKVVLAAADTFRAAAIDQLRVWAERSEVAFVAHKEGSDPSAVIFDGIKSAQAKNADVLICDTAGRLHNKVNLMNELNKMFRIIEREYPEAHKEVLLVLDATTGQNAVNQAKEFLQSAGITGLVVTKLDGTAKGGFVFAIKSELGIPVKLIGVGEKIEDLQVFDAESYASAVLNL